MYGCLVGWADFFFNINLNQMGSNGTHKNMTYLSKERKTKSAYSHWKVHLKKSAAPIKVKSINNDFFLL